MERSIGKYIIPGFWLLVLLDCIFLYFDLPYISITEPPLVPLLLFYVFVNDDNIGSPISKLIFYIGLIFSFFGDVLQLVVTNGFFFNSSLSTFIIMIICYSIFFKSLMKGKIYKPFFLVTVFLILLLIAYWFLSIMRDDFGDYMIPFMVYIGCLIIMVLLIINLTSHPLYSKIVLRYFFPGTILLIIQNMVFTVNLFRFNGQSKGFIISLICYSLFQFLMVKGVLKICVKK